MILAPPQTIEESLFRAAPVAPISLTPKVPKKEDDHVRRMGDQNAPIGKTHQQLAGLKQAQEGAKEKPAAPAPAAPAAPTPAAPTIPKEISQAIGIQVALAVAELQRQLRGMIPESVLKMDDKVAGAGDYLRRQGSSAYWGPGGFSSVDYSDFCFGFSFSGNKVTVSAGEIHHGTRAIIGVAETEVTLTDDHQYIWINHVLGSGAGTIAGPSTARPVSTESDSTVREWIVLCRLQDGVASLEKVGHLGNLFISGRFA